MGFIANIIGGLQGASAAGKAANAQVDAQTKAGQQVVDAAKAGNAQIQGATTDAQGNIIAAGSTAATGVTNAATTAASGVNAAANYANTGLDPYSTAGTTAAGVLDAGIAPGGDFNKTPTLADLQMDPGYAFRLQQGKLALDRSAAARGGVLGGGQLKAITDYAQGSASQEYQNAFQRFEQSTQNRFSNVSGVAARGQIAATQQGENTEAAAVYGGNVTNAAARYAGDVGVGTNEYAGSLGVNSAETQAAFGNAAARYQGDTTIGAGNAKAAGYLGKANAYNSILNGAGSILDNAAIGFAGGGGWSGAWDNVLAGGAP